MISINGRISVLMTTEQHRLRPTKAECEGKLVAGGPDHRDGT